MASQFYPLITANSNNTSIITAATRIEQRAEKNHIVCNNKKYSAMQRNHADYYPKGAAVQHDLWHGVHIDGPDYSELGQPFGFHGQRVEKPGELVGALKAGLASIQNGTTSILNVVLSR